jgi:hypothetical protein
MRPASTLVVCATVFASTVVTTSVAQAQDSCVCDPVTLESAFNDATDTISVEVLSDKIWHVYQEFYKVRVKEGLVIFVETRRFPGECGVDLEVGEKYLLTTYATTVPNLFTITQCGYNRPARGLTDAERDFLETRTLSCDDTGIGDAGGFAVVWTD